MNRLLSLLEQMDRPSCLAHVDCVPDNFLILPDGTGKIIDWEYARNAGSADRCGHVRHLFLL